VQLVILDPRDNVATAAQVLVPGAVVSGEDVDLLVEQDVPRGHKIALTDIPEGSDVIRYGEVIGRATAPIAPGQHVHVHNLVSRRLPGGAR
jgi:altronate dehydratase